MATTQILWAVDQTVDEQRLGVAAWQVGTRFRLAALREAVVVAAGVRETWDALLDALAVLPDDHRNAVLGAMLDRFNVQGHRFIPGPPPGDV